MKATRLEVNERIRLNFSEVEMVEVVDVATEIPMHVLEDEAEKSKWFCDGLHLTALGYKKVSSLISNVL
jgi:hypothetical protein